MDVGVQGIGLLAPGLNGWAGSLSIFTGQRPYGGGPPPQAEAALLPPNERRRSSDSVRWAIQVAQEAITQSGLDPGEVTTVFASSGGETAVLDQLCRSLAADRAISPTLFHHSVHNTAAGYWGIAVRCQASSTALACYDDSFAVGLLEAVTCVCVEKQPALLVAYDLTPPPPLFEARPIHSAFSVALVLTPKLDTHFGRLGVRLAACDGTTPTTVEDEALERLRLDNPAARSLPLLTALAGRKKYQVHLNVLDDQRLIIDVDPCRS